MGWHKDGTIYLTDLAAEENDDPKELAASFSIPTCEFKIEMEQRQFLDVSEKSTGEKGVAYSIKRVVMEPDPEPHNVSGVGGDGKGVGCVAQCAVHELRHKAFWLSISELEREGDALENSCDKVADEFGGDSIEFAYETIKLEVWGWVNGDGDLDRILNGEEWKGGDLGILSDAENSDTYNFASFFDPGEYDGYGDQEIRARAAEPTALYHAALDWSNPGCQYSDKPYGPVK